MKFHENQKLKTAQIQLLQKTHHKLKLKLNQMSLRPKNLWLKNPRPKSLRLMREAKISSSKKRILMIVAHRIQKQIMLVLEKTKKLK